MAEIQLSYSDTDLKLIRTLAREIALDIQPIETILNSLKIDANRWDAIQKSVHFRAALSEEIQYWASTPNAGERIKIKFLTMLEESAEEMWTRLHDPKESLSAKTELWKMVMRGAGVGVAQVDSSGGGERISINISMGADAKLNVEKDITPKVIEGEVL